MKTEKGVFLKERSKRFLKLFAIGCIGMMCVRLISIAQINPLQDKSASMALGIGLMSYLIYWLMNRLEK